MEEGCQKSKRLSYMARVKCDVQCAEEKGNHKAAAVFSVIENNIRLWGKHKPIIRKNCPMNGRSLLLYKFTRQAIKLTVIIIVGYHCYQLHTTFYQISFFHR
jgi:hypothetical protein